MDIENKPELDYHLQLDPTVIAKCQHSEVYSQNLYAAMCNNTFLYGDQEWSCSWRMSGGIVASIRNCGEEYIDWYCSGMSNKLGYIPESCITDEIKLDLMRLGWTIKSDG